MDRSSKTGWRDYDPLTARFTALDPIGYAGGDNDLYGYCLDDPVNLVDPEGLQSDSPQDSRSGNLEEYWIVSPKPGACDRCQALRDIKFAEKPERPHPNCKCKIERRTRLSPTKYAGADSAEGVAYTISHLVFHTKSETIDVIDSDGHLRRTFKATSGIPGETDPTKRNKGPIPEGEYEIHPQEVTKNSWRMRVSADWGEYRAPLHPKTQTKTHGRSGFYIHGGKRPGSAGCIDVGNIDKEILEHIQKQDKPVIIRVEQ